MYASGLLWAARDPVATILAYAIAMHEQYVNPHVCRMRTKQLGGWKRRGKTATENSGWRGGQNVHGIILNLFVGHYVGHEEERGRGLDLERVSPRGEFFAYFCAWRERKYFQERNTNPNVCLYRWGGKRLWTYRDLPNCATYGDYGSFRQNWRGEIWCKYIYISCEERGKNRRDECIFLNCVFLWLKVFLIVLGFWDEFLIKWNT